MDIDFSSSHVGELLARIDWPIVGLVGVPLLLAGFVLLAALSKRPDRRITLLATAIGLGWSAQGMWDTAVNAYDVPRQLAAVLFVLFEAFMVGRMLNANLYRHDPVRRARPARFVWTLALVMGAVVALAEGWEQAPLRFAVPLLVAWNWYLDLTADDDPAEALPSSWRWTPRRLLLAVGAIEPGERDVETINRERHVARMTTLAFRIRNGDRRIGDILHRPTRLAKLALTADGGMVREMHERLDRAAAVLTRPEPEPAPRPSRLHVPERRIVLPHESHPDRRVQGVHSREGIPLRGESLRADAVTLMRASISPAQPKGMTVAELAAHYDPPLKQRTADGFASEARKSLNGSAVQS